MLTEHLKPGHLTYMKVEAEYPAQLEAFVTYVHARQVWQIASDMVRTYRDAAGKDPKNRSLADAWQDAAIVYERAGVTSSDARMFLARQLKAAGYEGDAYAWIEIQLRALELEAGVSCPAEEAA